MTQLDRARNASRAARARFVEWFGVWHRVRDGARFGGTFTIACSGARAFGRTAMDMPAQGVCAACAQTEHES